MTARTIYRPCRLTVNYTDINKYINNKFYNTKKIIRNL